MQSDLTHANLAYIPPRCCRSSGGPLRLDPHQVVDLWTLSVHLRMAAPQSVAEAALPAALVDLAAEEADPDAHPEAAEADPEADQRSGAAAALPAVLHAAITQGPSGLQTSADSG